MFFHQMYWRLLNLELKLKCYRIHLLLVRIRKIILNSLLFFFCSFTKSNSRSKDFEEFKSQEIEEFQDTQELYEIQEHQEIQEFQELMDIPQDFQDYHYQLVMGAEGDPIASYQIITLHEMNFWNY